ncbi:MAG TPA: insulinase family protein [Flavisolibacter sp.]|nr:insulinase family protein [Flavisolibacter sp.]
MSKSRLVMLLAAFTYAASCLAQTPPSKPLPIDAKVKIGKLANGLTYYIRENKKPEKKVELRLAVNTGSIMEDADQQGLAHFMEHMNFNGTENYKKNELVSFLQSIGVQFGADLNAYTGFDETVYILPIPLSDTSNFRKGLQVLRDWAGGASLESDEIDKERGVVLEESRLGKGAEDRMFRKIYPYQYAGSKYAERLPIGKDSILKNFKYDAVKRFYKEWYRPNLMAVVVVGDVDAAKAEAYVKSIFGSMKNPAKFRPRTEVPVTARTRSMAMVVTDKEATNYNVEISYPFVKQKPETTEADYRHWIVKNIFTSMLNQRLQELTQSSKPPFLYGFGYFNSYARGYEGFTAAAGAGQDGPEAAVKALITEVERVKKFGFTQAELDRARSQTMASMERTYNNRDKTESDNYVREYVSHFLSKEPIPGIEKEFAYHKDFLPTIKLEEVNALAAPLKKNENLFVTLQGPEATDKKLPDSTELLAIVSSTMKADVKAYEEKAVASSLLKAAPVAGKITGEKKVALTGVTELTLSNGAKVVLKPTDFKNDEIVMTAFHKGGTSKYGADKKFSANYASTVVQTMGVGELSPTDLNKFLAGKVARVTPRISATNAGVSGNSTVKDLETMLQLTHLYLTAPRKDEGLFTAWRDKQKTAVQNIMADPQTAFVDSLFGTLYNRHPLAPIAIPKPEYFDQVKLDDALAIYKDLTGDASDFTFIFTGSIDPEKLKPLLETYIGSLPSTGKAATITDNGLRMATGQKEIKFYRGTEDKSLVLQMHNAQVTYSEDLELKAQALAEIINIKVIEDLREKLGAIYGGGVNIGVSKYPYSSFTAMLQLPTGPKTVDTLLTSFNAEIEKLKMNGPPKADLDKVKKQWIERYRTQVKENGTWSNKLYNIYFQESDPQRFINYEAVVNALTVDDIKAVANQLFNGKNVITAVQYPQDLNPKKGF